MENAVYSGIDPESCTGILWWNNKFKTADAEAMKLIIRDISDAGVVVDEIIREPPGGIQMDWQTTMKMLSIAVVKHIIKLQEIPIETLPAIRADKFIPMTRYVKIIGCDIKQLNK